jgi:HJR/Mrr/RecB family endonuclease
MRFNENNVTTYLSELEEYVSNLITFLAWKSNDRHFQHSSLALDLLQPKEFDKGPMTIDAPTAIEFNQTEEETDIGDDLITDPQAKIRQMEELLNKKKTTMK